MEGKTQSPSPYDYAIHFMISTTETNKLLKRETEAAGVSSISLSLVLFHNLLSFVLFYFAKWTSASTNSTSAWEYNGESFTQLLYHLKHWLDSESILPQRRLLYSNMQISCKKCDLYLSASFCLSTGCKNKFQPICDFLPSLGLHLEVPRNLYGFLLLPAQFLVFVWSGQECQVWCLKTPGYSEILGRWLVLLLGPGNLLWPTVFQ